MPARRKNSRRFIALRHPLRKFSIILDPQEFRNPRQQSIKVSLWQRTQQRVGALFGQRASLDQVHAGKQITALEDNVEKTAKVTGKNGRPIHGARRGNLTAFSEIGQGSS